MFLLEYFGVELPIYLNAVLSLVVGLMIIQVACQVLVSTTERFAARMRWTHYVAGTVAEILSTLPEIVVIAFLVPVSPLTAFVVAMVTIYNNALVFSIYSYFLPRDQQGKFLMPKPITDSGSQILIAGGVLGLIDHIANSDGETEQVAKDLHRVDPQQVKNAFAESCFAWKFSPFR